MCDDGFYTFESVKDYFTNWTEESSSEELNESQYFKQYAENNLENCHFTCSITKSPLAYINESDHEINHFSSNNNKYINDIEDESSSASSDSPLTIESLPENVRQWNSSQVMLWLLEFYGTSGYRYVDLNLHLFKDKTGTDLFNLQESDWKNVDKTHYKTLYQAVQKLEKSDRQKQLSLQEQHANLLYNFEPRKRGRPKSLNSKPKKQERVGRIWEFLRDLLKNPLYCPSLIKWKNLTKLEFKLCNPKAIAKIWGAKKNKEDMKYENFSRSIRHYYNLNHSKIKSVPNDRLVYKFTKEALTAKDFEQFVPVESYDSYR